MNSMNRLMTITALLAIFGVSTFVYGQGAASDAQNKLLAKRAAEADCYRKLAESVYGVQLSSDTYVRDFVTESDEIRTGVDALVKGVKLGSPRFYDDGICEIDGEVTVAKLVTTLTKVHNEHYKGRRVTITDIEHVKKRIKTDVIRATGMGAPRPDVPNLPDGFEDNLTPLPTAVTPVSHVPAIWKSVGPQARLMAQRAARLDAMRRLLEEIKGLRLNSDTLVRDFVTESDEISTRAQGLVVGAATVSIYLHDDELIAEVTMEVPVEKVITRIKEFHSEHYKGRRVTSTHVENVKKTITRKMIRATGMGVPPSKFMQKAVSAGVESPDWLSRTFSAVGEGTDSEMDKAQGKLRAARAAELDAKRKLAEEVFGLSIQSTTTVRDFVTEHDEIASQVQAALVGVTVSRAEFGDGVATVRVSLPAAQIWSVVHQHTQVLKRRG